MSNEDGKANTSGKTSNIHKSTSFGHKLRIIETEEEPLSASNLTSIESTTERRHKRHNSTSISSSTPTTSRNNVVMDEQQRRNLQDLANTNLELQQQRLQDQRNAARNQLNLSGLSNRDFNNQPTFNIAGFNPDEAIRLIQGKCLLSNTIPPNWKQELLAMCSIARQRAHLDNEAQNSILRELATTSSGLLAGRAFSQHMTNVIDATSLGLPIPPAPQIRYPKQPRGSYRAPTRPSGRGGQRPRN